MKRAAIGQQGMMRDKVQETKILEEEVEVVVMEEVHSKAHVSNVEKKGTDPMSVHK